MQAGFCWLSDRLSIQQQPGLECHDSFELYLRIPKWATSATVQIGNSHIIAPPVDPQSRLIEIKVPSGKYENSIWSRKGNADRPSSEWHYFCLQRPAPICISYPSYCFLWTTRVLRQSDSLPDWNIFPQAQDYTLVNNTQWKIAIDPTTLVFHQGSEPLPSPTFEYGKLPSIFTAKVIGLCFWEWSLALPFQTMSGNASVILLRLYFGHRYGSAKLHMSQLPTINHSE